MKPNQSRRAAEAQSRSISIRDATPETIARYTQPRGGVHNAVKQQQPPQRPPSAGGTACSVFSSSSRSGSSRARPRVAVTDVFPGDLAGVPDEQPQQQQQRQSTRYPPSVFGGAPPPSGAAAHAPLAQQQASRSNSGRMLGVPFPTDATFGGGPPTKQPPSRGGLSFGSSFPGSMQPMHAALPPAGGGAPQPMQMQAIHGRRATEQFQASFSSQQQQQLAAGSRTGQRRQGESSFVFG